MLQLIKNATVINEGQISRRDVLIKGERIEAIDETIEPKVDYNVIDATGLYLMPGMIDTHVHFREPGLTYKGTIATESRAAIAGGVTSFMEMPNTLPNTTTLQRLEEKYELASQTAYCNYSFYFGLNAQNMEEALQIDNTCVCGITDDGLYFDQKDSLLCNNHDYLEKLFSKSQSLIALHCEDETLIAQNEEHYRAMYGEHIPAGLHTEIRGEQACYNATKKVVELARQYNARVHILHVSTGKETSLFESDAKIENKRITAEACVHHLYFNSQAYDSKGLLVKWNPSIKHESDRVALLKAIKDRRIDNIATDHAPHALEEKLTDYFSCKSGAPSVQHVLPALLELYHQGTISLEDIVEKTSHNPAEIFRITDRGYIRQGYYADLVLVNLNASTRTEKARLLYKCGWSPFENEYLRGTVETVFVNGTMVMHAGRFTEQKNSKRLIFNKNR
jgi:dihydroorotase